MALNGRLFDPDLYASVRKPLLEAEALPAWCYTSDEFYRREVESIFGKCWNFVARVDELPSPGSYLVFDLIGESVIIVRDQDNEVRAFVNSCRHRGTRLLEGTGECRLITCPYHAWAFAPSGKLVAAPGMEDSKNFNFNEWGLIPVRLETWAGYMFICFDTKAPPLNEYLGDLPEKFASYNLDEMICVRRQEYELACNWKIFVENAIEDYHTPTVHRKSIGKQVTEREDTRGNWDAIHHPSDKTIAILPGDTTPFPHIEGLTGRTATGTYFTAIYPSTFFATTQDCMWWLQTIPLGPRRMRVIHGACFPRSTVARGDFGDVVERYYRRWDKSIPEDNGIAEQQQAGLESSLARPGRLSIREPLVHAMANWILDRVLVDEAMRRSA
jgi:choline monooxygenase